MNQRTALGVIAAIGALAVVSAAVAVLVSAPRLAGPIPTLSPAEALSPDQRAGFAKLQLDSRPMALAIEPDEVAYGHVVSVDSARADVVADRARALGLRPVVSDEEPPSVSFRATRSTILEIAALREVANAWIEEDVAANRGISHPLPAGTQFPVPGMPYAETGLAVDASELAIRGDRLRGLLGPIAAAVVTIDGRPYADARVEGSCDETRCDLSLFGFPDLAAGHTDVWRVQSSEATAWLGAPIPGDAGPEFHGVPRWLVREAERIARTDPAAAAAIARYELILDATWSPAMPGVISLFYSTPCGLGGDVSGPLGGQLADTGECIDQLMVVVDVPGGRVIELRGPRP
jgi:hypothetical protein